MIDIQPYNCPICNEKNYNKIKTFSDGIVVGKCNGCGLIYTPKRHNTPEDLFGKISMERLHFLYDPILAKKKNHFRKRIFHKYLKKIKKYSSGDKHLDIGCAHGFFMDISRNNGFEVKGVEPNKMMRDFGVNCLNLDILHGTLNEVSLDGKWDVITFTDSMEYFLDPLKDLSKLITTNLNDKGIIFIKVPNGDYFHARHKIKKFGLSLGGAEPFSPSKRVTHYNYNTIKKLMEKVNMEILETGFFVPINSPVWFKLTGVHLEFESPWYLGLKEKLFRKILHILGSLEFLFLRKNHFSQSVYILARKK